MSEGDIIGVALTSGDEGDTVEVLLGSPMVWRTYTWAVSEEARRDVDSALVERQLIESSCEAARVEGLTPVEGARIEWADLKGTAEAIGFESGEYYRWTAKVAVLCSRLGEKDG